jgi:hypothetical protein
MRFYVKEARVLEEGREVVKATKCKIMRPVSFPQVTELLGLLLGLGVCLISVIVFFNAPIASSSRSWTFTNTAATQSRPSSR